MEEIMEEYGIGLLQILGGIGALLLFRSFVQPEGIVYKILMQYIGGICG